MKNPWKKLSSKIVHKNPWYFIRKDKVIRPDGKPGEYNVMVTPPSVFIVAVNEKKEVYLVSLFRYTTGMPSIEVPAGGSDNQKPLVAAKRELEEEAGLIAKSWKRIGTFQTANGFMSEIGHVFLAQDLIEVSTNHQKEEGIEKLIRVPFREALAMAHDGTITDAQTIVCLNLAKKYL